MSVPTVLAATAEIPEQIQVRLPEAGIVPEDVFIGVERDLDDTGRIRSIWLIVTEQSVAVVPSDSSDSVSGPYRLDEVEDFRISNSVGNASLQVILDGLPVSERHRHPE